jgi:hypothetical protein
MRQTALVLALFAALASGAPAQQTLAPRLTVKPVDSFAQCFVATQEQASAAWSYVPREDGGGTFSNAGAAGVRHPYLIEVADRGATRVIRLRSAGADRSVLRAVDRCV